MTPPTPCPVETWAAIKDAAIHALGTEAWANLFEPLRPSEYVDDLLTVATDDEMVGMVALNYLDLLNAIAERAGLPCTIDVVFRAAPVNEARRAAVIVAERRVRASAFTDLARTIAPRYTAASFESYEHGDDSHAAIRKACADRVRKWASAHAEAGPGRKGAGRVLVLAGGIGAGKTHLAWSALRGMYVTGWRVHAINVSAFLQAVRESYNGGPDPMPAAIRADVLLWDDLGTQSGTEHSVRVLYELANARYEAGRAEIITTNAGALAGGDELGFFRGMVPCQEEQRMQALRVADRLREDSDVVLFAAKRGDRLVAIPSWRGRR